MQRPKEGVLQLLGMEVKALNPSRYAITAKGLSVLNDT